METISPILVKNEEFLEFITAVKSSFSYQSIASFQDKEIRNGLFSLAKNLFSEAIALAEKQTNDPDRAACCIDFPESGLSPSEDALWSATAAVAFNGAFKNPILDSVTKTPFTLIQASKEEQEKLAAAGLDYFSPEQKLGFHSDGVFQDGSLYIPHFISTYNIFLGYAKPGCFYWVPLSRWEEKNKYFEKIASKEYLFKLTPITYTAVGEGIEIHRNETIKAPIFIEHDEGTSLFMNGKVLPSEDYDINVVTDMKTSLSSVRNRIAIEQRTKRLIVVKNSAGVHARDIFEMPLFDDGITRSMLRSVDQHGVKVKIYD